MNAQRYTLVVLACGVLAAATTIGIDRAAATMLRPAAPAVATEATAVVRKDQKPKATVRTTVRPLRSAATGAVASEVAGAAKAPPSTPQAQPAGQSGHDGEVEVLFQIADNVAWSQFLAFCQRHGARFVTVAHGEDGVASACEHSAPAGARAIVGGDAWQRFVDAHPANRWLWIELPRAMAPLRDLPRATAEGQEQIFLVLPPAQAGVVWECCATADSAPSRAVRVVAEMVIDATGHAQLRARKES